ncbi:beta strand repeat-containing protein [Lactococcus nasutitermitis]|uniref:Beta strand repeat-containing protein n=1 Tax=Lactococcus nasutitermitis TaxID=1652957 RepID=A0ABV9JCH4_9LACT|nr:KxYKxGKxW signal peptide domain-containing protein [Lactococcus nasutitermitis]
MLFSKKETKLTHFRTWKTGKKWLYGASTLALLVGGTVISSHIQPQIFEVRAFAADTNNPTDTSSSANPNSNVNSVASSMTSATSGASSDLSSAVSNANSQGVITSSSTTDITVSLADGSSYASSVTSSIASNYESQVSSLSAIASEQSSLNGSYAAASSAVSSANSAANSTATALSETLSSAISEAELSASAIASMGNVSYTTSDITVTPDYVTVSSGATASEIASAASYNASLYSSAVSSAMESLASEVSSVSSYMSSAIAATNPSSAGNFTVTTGSVMSQNFVLNSDEVDSSAPTVSDSNATIASGTITTSTGGTFTTNEATSLNPAGTNYTSNWGNTSYNTGGYAIDNLSVGDTVTKTWQNIGTLNGEEVSATVTVTVGQLAGNLSHGWMTVSDNFGTFMTINNFSGNFQIQYTWASGANAGEPLTLADINTMSILGASLTPTYSNGLTTETEYITTADATGAILSNDPNYPAQVGAITVDGASLGLPDGLNTIFGAPDGSTSTAGSNDAKPNSFAKAHGVSFAQFTSTTPTFYFGTYNYSTGESYAEANHLMMSAALAYTPAFVTVAVPDIVAPTLETPTAPTALTANYEVFDATVTATAPTINAPATETGSINTPLDLTQGGQVTGEDNGTIYDYPNSDVVVTVTDPSGNTTTLPVGSMTYTPTSTGNYTITYTYTSGNGTASASTNIAITSPMTGTGNETSVPVNTPATLKNIVTPSTGASITDVSVGTATGPDGNPIPAEDISATPDGTVTLIGQPTPGAYTIPVTYTDSAGNTVTVEDIVVVSPDPMTGTGDETSVPVNTPASLTNTVTPSTGATITTTTVGTVTGPDGTPVPSSDVTANPDGTVTLAGQPTPGTYTIPVTYTDSAGNTVTVNDIVVVSPAPMTGTGNETSVPVNTPASLTNTVTPSTGATITTATVGAVTGPDGTTVSSSDVTANPDGTVTLSGQPIPGIYTIPVTYTDSAGNTITVNDIVVVSPNPMTGIGGKTSVPVNTPATLTNTVTPSTGATITGVSVETVTGPNGITVLSSDVTAHLDGTVTFNGQTIPGTYSFDVTYTDSIGNTITVHDTVLVSEVVLSKENTKTDPSASPQIQSTPVSPKKQANVTPLAQNVSPSPVSAGTTGLPKTGENMKQESLLSLLGLLFMGGTVAIGRKQKKGNKSFKK